MDKVGLDDLLLMLANSNGQNHQANLDILRSLYERRHSYYLTVISALIALIGSVIGILVSPLTQGAASDDRLTVAIGCALAIVLLLILYCTIKLTQLRREYLDIIQVYNLLARFF